jgi:hypothetical protein
MARTPTAGLPPGTARRGSRPLEQKRSSDYRFADWRVPPRRAKRPSNGYRRAPLAVPTVRRGLGARRPPWHRYLLSLRCRPLATPATPLYRRGFDPATIAGLLAWLSIDPCGGGSRCTASSTGSSSALSSWRSSSRFGRVGTTRCGPFHSSLSSPWLWSAFCWRAGRDCAGGCVPDDRPVSREP